MLSYPSAYFLAVKLVSTHFGRERPNQRLLLRSSVVILSSLRSLEKSYRGVWEPFVFCFRLFSLASFRFF